MLPSVPETLQTQFLISSNHLKWVFSSPSYMSTQPPSSSDLPRETSLLRGGPRIWSHIFLFPSPELFWHHAAHQETYISHTLHGGIRADESNMKPPSLHRDSSKSQGHQIRGCPWASFTPEVFDESSQPFTFLKKIECVVDILQIGKFHNIFFRFLVSL